MTNQTKQVELPEEARKIITDISLGSEMSSEEKLGAIARLEGVLAQAQQEAVESFAVWLSTQDEYKDKTVIYKLQEYETIKKEQE